MTTATKHRLKRKPGTDGASLGSFRLREEFLAPFHQVTSEQIDRERGIIHGVKVCGLFSKNGRRYPSQTLREALHLYEGVGVYFNPHPPKETDARDPACKVGWLQNVRFVEGQGLYADLHLLQSHEHTPRILEAAERNPRLYSLSHDASGDLSPAGQDGYKEVLRISEVWAIDLVDRGGTNSSLFESQAMKTTLRRLIEAETRLDQAFRTRILEMDEDPILDTEFDAPAEDSTSGDDHLIAAISALLKSDDPADHEKVKKIMAILKPAEAVITEENDEKKEDEEEYMTESEARKLKDSNTRLTEELETFKLRDYVRDEAGKRNIPLDGKQVDHVAAMKTKEHIREHLDYLRDLITTKNRNGPRSSGPHPANGNPAPQLPKSAEEFAKMYRGR